MRNEKLTMRNTKYGMTFLSVLVCIILFSACNNPIQKQADGTNSLAAGMGRVVIAIAAPGNERTAMPQEAIAITEYGIVIIRQGETVPCWNNTGSSLSVTADLPQGTYTVSVSGYNEIRQLIAVGTGEVIVSAGQTSGVLIQMKTSGNEAGNGTLRYSLDIADDILFQYGFLSLYALPGGGLSHSLQIFDNEGMFYHPAGYYRAVISAWIIKDGVMQVKTKTAVVHLYVRHETTVTLELDEDSGAIGNEYTVSTAAELDAALNSIRTGAEKNVIVTVTANFSHAPISISDSGYNNKAITLRSANPADVRAITLSGSGSLFTVGSEQSSPALVLSDIKLAGHGSNNVPLVRAVRGIVIINDGAEISGNTNYNNPSKYSDFRGGGIAVEIGAVLKMYGGTIRNNTVSSGNLGSACGGGVVVWGNFQMFAGAIENNHIPAGIYNYGGGVIIEDGGVFKLYGGNIRNNTLTADNNILGGCGVAVNGIFEMYGGSIEHHNDNSNKTIKGGGVYVSASGTVVMNGGEVCYNNLWKNGYGAGIFTEGDFTLNGGKIHHNTVMDATMPANYGGGIYFERSMLALNGGEIYNNAALRGGGISIGQRSASYNNNVILNGTEIYENTACEGAGIAVYRANLTIESGRIEGNFWSNNDWGEITSGAGAGIYFYYGDKSLVMNGGHIKGNRISITSTSEASGGGIAIEWGSFIMNGGHIEGNSVTSTYNAHGGGIYVAGTNSALTLNGGRVAANSSDTQGGGIYFKGTGIFKMSGGVISGNSSAQGGGILLGSNSGGFEKNFYGTSAVCGIIYGNEVIGADEFGYELKNTGLGASIRKEFSSAQSKNTTVGETMTLFQNTTENWAD